MIGGKLLFVAVALLISVSASNADLVVQETRVTNNIYDQYGPDIYDDYIVWEDNRDYYDTGIDIWGYRISTAVESPFVQGPVDQTYPAIWGNNIVYQDNSDVSSGGPASFDIWKYEIGGSAVYLTKNNSDEYQPSIYGNRVVFERDTGGNNWDIYKFDLVSSLEQALATTASWEQQACTAKNYTAFIKWNGSDYDLYVYNHATSVTVAISTESGNQWFPRTDGRRIVWEDWRDPITAPDIRMYDFLTQQESVICSEMGEQILPAISGSYIVWSDKRSGNFKVRLYDLNTGVEQAVSQNTSSYALWPRVWANRIVWTDGRHGGDDIYLAQVGPEYTSYNQIGQAKLQADDSGVELQNKIVARNLGDQFAIIDSDRSAGILVNGIWDFQSGDRVTVRGILKTNASGERIIEPSLIDELGSVSMTAPLSVRNGSVGGGGLGSYTLGVTGHNGANNVGNFVRTMGKVKSIGSGFFYISDGSAISDTVGPAGSLRIECPGITPPNVGSIVAVTGISRLYKPAAEYHRMIYVTQESDILVF